MATITSIKMNSPAARRRWRWGLILVLWFQLFPLISSAKSKSKSKAKSKAKSIATTTTTTISSPFTADEQAFLEIPSAKTAKSSLKFLTMAPHVAGTDGDRNLAEFVRQEFLKAGIPEVSIEDLVVRLNYPNFASNSTSSTSTSTSSSISTSNGNGNGRSSSLSLWETVTTVEDEDKDKESETSTESETKTVVLGEQHLVRRKKRDTTTIAIPTTTTTITPPLPLPLPQEPPQKRKPKNKRKLVFEASLSEDLLDPGIDATTDTKWRNHTFHGYSPSGTISHTKFVYANYGRPQDFRVLHKIGMSVKGKIVLMRYGRCFRGLKVRNAQQRGAVAAILYSDPADDGYSLGDVYPDGPWRPSSGVQRGSVQFNSQCGGDPYRADPRYNNKNTTVQELCGIADPSKELVPSIPSIPISYGDAIPLLQNLGGAPVAEIPEALANDFIGGLGRGSNNNNNNNNNNCNGNASSCVTYRIGPSKGYLDMMVDNVDTLATIPNVVGIIPGSLPPDKDQPVLLGNHRDAWVYGAADPNSGTSALLEVARGLGALYTKRKWRPLRSIYLLSWSGEEYGLLGSTGWAELNMVKDIHRNETSLSSTASASASLLQRSLAYLNTDTVVSGDHLKVAASPTLVSVWEQVVSDLKGENVAADADDVAVAAGAGNETTAIPTWQGISEASRFLRDVTVVDANSAREIPSSDENVKDDGTNIGILGSGSDYTVFLDHFGIPSLDFSYSNSKALYGQYHSIYDSFAWMDRFGGTTSKGNDGDDDYDETIEGSSFELMAFAAKLWGLLGE